VEQAPDQAEYLEIGFEKGVPVSVNGKAMGPVELLNLVNEYGSRHGVGTIDIVENRLVGMKSRGVYETPGGTILYKAHSTLEKLVLDRDTLNYKNTVALKFAQLVYDGLWYTP
jgi:argininosuccinate synthase